MKIFDITVNIHEKMLLWPNDPQVEVNPVLRIKDGQPANVSEIKLGSHSGTHIDAPFHFNENGMTIDKVSLYDLIGNVLVIETEETPKITEKSINKYNLDGVKRIIFKTKNSEILPKNKFNENFVSLDIKLARVLVDMGVSVIGFDYLSIEEYGSEEFPVHKFLANKNVVILETLNLDNVQSGTYQLIALPLKIKGLDGSPARIILINNI